MMDPLQPCDERLVVSRLPRPVRKLVVKHAGAAYIGGGFVRDTIANERASDIDVFGPGKDTLKTWALEYAEGVSGRLHETDNAFTVLAPPRKPVQFIHRWTFTDARALIESFDFTVAQAVVWVEEERGEENEESKIRWRSLCSDRFYPDLAARRLVYTHPHRNEDAGGSLLRVRKFLTRGYTIQAPALAGVVARLALAIGWDKIDNEQQATQVLTGLLREVDPLFVVDGLDPVDEHQAT